MPSGSSSRGWGDGFELREPGPRFFVVRTRLRDVRPELWRMVHALQVHQLVDQHVVPHPIGHRHEPPVERDPSRARARTPSPALVADRDPGHGQAELRGELQQPRGSSRFACMRSARTISGGMRSRGCARSRSARSSCAEIQSCCCSTNSIARRLEPRLGIVTRTRPSALTRTTYRRARGIPDEDSRNGSGRRVDSMPSG